MAIIRPSRRDMLRYLGASSLALPILSRDRPAFADHGEAHKRIIFFFTPNGTVPSTFWPSGGETNFTLSEILTPLDRASPRVVNLLLHCLWLRLAAE